MKKLSLVVAVVLLVGVCFYFAGEVLSQTPQASTQATGPPAGSSIAESGSMDKVGRVLFVFLVLSVVFEVALTPIFNWRVFMAHFDEKGLKTPIIVALAFVVFWGYDLDIISDLLTALGKPTGISLGGQILTALLIAGGSSGVFQIFTKIGIRMNPEDRKKKAEEAREEILDKKGPEQKADKKTKEKD